MFIEHFMMVIISILIVLPFVLTYLCNKHKVRNDDIVLGRDYPILSDSVTVEKSNCLKIPGYELCDGTKIELDKYPILKKYMEENRIPSWKIVYYKLLRLLRINTFKLPDLRDQFIKPNNPDNQNS